MKNILEKIKERPLIFDGAMGTMIYSKGVFINTCYEHLCITNPGLIAGIHQAYVDAGADVIETNSYGANRIKLQAHGLVDQLEEINRAAVRLAREAAGDGVLVAGSVGPCLKSSQLFVEARSDELAEVFREQLAILADEGIDLFLLETFTHVQEARLAASVAKPFGLPVYVSVTVGKDGETRRGEKIEQLVQALDADVNVDGIGINCGVSVQA